MQGGRPVSEARNSEALGRCLVIRLSDGSPLERPIWSKYDGKHSLDKAHRIYSKVLPTMRYN